MPSKAEELAVFQRDGWRCRVCGVRVLFPKAVKKLRDLFPEAARWGRRNVDQHSACLSSRHRSITSFPTAVAATTIRRIL